MRQIGSTAADVPAWGAVRERLRERGLRWTPQRRNLVDVLAQTDGHITGAELVERCRQVDPQTTPSTVYRTLDVLEGLGVIRHNHGVDGREEFHVLPASDHGHLFCKQCGQAWEIDADEASTLLTSLERSRGFRAELSHLTVVGECRDCHE
jgi:Fur family ferric uptake transcriptional regulator